MHRSYQKNPEYRNKLTKDVPPSLLELSEDLGQMYETEINNDLSICLDEGNLLCHRVVLSARSKWCARLSEQWKLEQRSNIKLNKNIKIIEALLVYMYTGNLCLLESFKVPLYDLREAAAVFELDRLIELLDRILKSVVVPYSEISNDFFYLINIEDFFSIERHSYWLYDNKFCYLYNFSIDGTDDWTLYFEAEYSEGGKHIVVYLMRTNINMNICVTHIASLEMHIIDTYGTKRPCLHDICIFKEDGCYRMGKGISLRKLQENAEDILPNGVLSLSCTLTISLVDDFSIWQPIFEIKNQFEEDVIKEFHALSNDMYKLMEDEKFWDVSILVKEASILKANTAFLYARTQIPTLLSKKLMGLGHFNNSVWKSFIYYLYTGQTRYVQDHMREIYVAVSKLQLCKMQKRYSRILANNLTVGNVFGVLSDAKAFEDTELLKSGMDFMAINGVTDNRW